MSAENPLDKIDYVDESSLTQKVDIQRHLKALYSVRSELENECPNADSKSNYHSGSASMDVVSNGRMCDLLAAQKAEIESFVEHARHKGVPWSWIDEVADL